MQGVSGQVSDGRHLVSISMGNGMPLVETLVNPVVGNCFQQMESNMAAARTDFVYS
jgi:hypothetical protein